MSNAETLIAVIRQLREIFLDKSELTGYDDWDKFFGCINAIEQVVSALQEEVTEKTTEETGGDDLWQINESKT